MSEILTSPLDLVSKALEINRDLVNEDSAMGETPNWDSLNQVIIIGEMEKAYGITIPNEKIEDYTTMKAIIEVYKKQSGKSGLRNRFIEMLKKSSIGKIFFKKV